MIPRMTRGMMRAQRSALRHKRLPVVDPGLPVFRLMFMDRRVWTEFEQVRDSTDVVAVPVRDERLVDGCLFLLQHGAKRRGPLRLTFACVD